jgi:hypothetical protein
LGFTRRGEETVESGDQREVDREKEDKETDVVGPTRLRRVTDFTMSTGGQEGAHSLHYSLWYKVLM